MERFSGQKRASLIRRSDVAYEVVDVIGHRKRDDSPIKAGVILFLRGCSMANPDAVVGLTAMVYSSVGQVFIGKIAMVRSYESSLGILVEGPTKHDVPVGSWVSIIWKSSRRLIIPDEFLNAIADLKRNAAVPPEPAAVS